jgi:hypothetical protein
MHIGMSCRLAKGSNIFFLGLESKGSNLSLEEELFIFQPDAYSMFKDLEAQ